MVGKKIESYSQAIKPDVIDGAACSLEREVFVEKNRKHVTLRFLLDNLKRSTGNYSYDVVLPDRPGDRTLLWQCAIEILKTEPSPPYVPPTSGMGRVMTFPEETRESKLAEEIHPLVADVLWQLCLRGYLRPGARGEIQYYQRPGGEGYSLTLRGREWIEAVSEDEFNALLATL